MANIEKIGALASKLERMASDAALEGVSRRLADEAMRLTFEGFRFGRDPYGRMWDSNKRGGWVLMDTLRMKESLSLVGVTRSGFRIEFGVDYAGYHQFGTSRMVARKLFPDAAQGLGNWLEPFTRVARKALNAAVSE